MKNGDLSNEVVPRLLLVFEGALGILHNEPEFRRYIRRKKWLEAAYVWQLNELMCQKIWDVTVRMSFHLEIVTFAGPPEFGVELERRLQDYEELPVPRVWATRPELLARKITLMPDLAVIYDPDPARALTWGPKGRVLADPNQLGT